MNEAVRILRGRSNVILGHFVLRPAAPTSIKTAKETLPFLALARRLSLALRLCHFT
jgi:hypothetical protein